MPRKKPQCPRCGAMNSNKAKQCHDCGTWLPERFWSMTKARRQAVHVLASQKGLIIGSDREMYDLELSKRGLKSCIDMNKKQFTEFMDDMKKLRDYVPAVKRQYW